MNNFLLTVAGALVLVLSLLFAVPPLINWNDYRGAFEEEVSRLLDREVRVRGRVNVRLLPVPYVSFEKVRISDARGIPGSFASAEQFKMWLAVPPLLRGVLEARQIELDKPSFRLRVDKDGRGNWQKLKINARGMGFVPAEVALNSVRITDGEVILESPKGEAISSITAVSGEFQAAALAGPFKFVGDMHFAGSNHNVRFSTATADAEGSVRFRTAVRSPDGSMNLTLDGNLSDLFDKTRVEGQIAARRTGKGGPDRGFEMSAGMKLDATSLRLSDINLSFAGDERPQTMSGDAVTTWDNSVVTRTTLSSRWLDLHAVTGMPASTPPMEVARRLLLQTIEPLGAGETHARLTIDQAGLGGEVVSGLHLRTIRRGGATQVEHLRASLPGRTDFAADGFIARQPDGLQLDQGHVVATGESLATLVKWLQIDAEGIDSALTGAFTINSALQLRAKSVALRQANFEIGPSRGSGDLSYDWAAEPLLKADLSIERLRLTRDGDGSLHPRRLIEWLSLAPPSASGRFTDWIRGPALDVHVRGDDIGDEIHRYSDVDAAFRRTGNTLEIRHARATWEPGLSIDLKGKLDGIGQEPAGALTGGVAASGEQAMENLAALAGLALRKRLGPGIAAAKAPMRAALDIKLSRDGKSPSTIIGDGSLGNDHFRLALSSSGPMSGWLTQPGRADLTVAGVDPRPTLRRLAALPASEAAAADGAPRPVAVRMAAIGVPANGLKVFATIEAGDELNARYEGRAQVERGERADPLRVAWSGAFDVRAADFAEVAAILAPDLAPFAKAAALRGRINITGGDGLTVTPEDFAIGASRVSGRVELAATAAGRAGIRGEVSVDRVALEPLAGLLLRDGPVPADATGEGTIWPRQAFDLRALNGYDVDLGIRVASLDVTSRLNVREAAWKLVSQGVDVRVQDFKGQLGDGQLAGNIEFQPSQSGVATRGRIMLSGLKIAGLAPNLAAERVGGVAGLDVQFAGTALTPQSLATVASGRGTVRLEKAKVPGLDADSLTKLAEGVIAAEVDVEALEQRLGELASNGAVDLGDRSLSLEIANGAIRVAEFAVDGGRGDIRNRTTIDVSRWQVDSEWIIRSAPQPKADAPDQLITLPPIRVVYAGSAQEPARIDPQISVGDLQRELVVRRMEADVARLERQRREDEARAAAEAERLRKIEEEQRRSLEEERRRRLQEQGAASPANPAGDSPGSGTVSPNDTTGRVLDPAPVPPGSVPVVPGTAAPGDAANAAAPPADGAAAGPVEPPAPRRITRPKPAFNPWSQQAN